MMNQRRSLTSTGHDVTIRPLLLLLLMLCMLKTGSSGITCRRYQRLLDGKCSPCPKCTPGYGLDKECGYGDGADARCQPCPSRFFNPYPGGSTCQACLNCSHFNREVAYQCRPVIDAECGACKPGYYDANADDAVDSMIYPCEPCSGQLSHPDCHTAVSPQIMAPVTTKLQANAQPSESESESVSSSGRAGVIAVTLGVLCVTALFAITLLLMRQRKLMRRLRQWYSGEHVAQINEIPGASTSPLISQPFQHDNPCMLHPQLHTAPWCNVTTPNPDRNTHIPHPSEQRQTEAKRKRNLTDTHCTSIEENIGDVEEEYRDERIGNKLHKRPRVTGNIENTEDEWRESPWPGLTIRLRTKSCQDDNKVHEDLNQAHNPHITITHDGVRPVTQTESEEGEDEDDGPMESQELAMDTTDAYTVSLGQIVDYATSEDEDNDLQQLGACAMGQEHRAAIWPYVDFTDMMQDAGSQLSFGDLHLGDSDHSQGSSGNISQASTVLIRGQSPDDITDGATPVLPPHPEQDMLQRAMPDLSSISDVPTLSTALGGVDQNPSLPTLSPMDDLTANPPSLPEIGHHHSSSNFDTVLIAAAPNPDSSAPPIAPGLTAPDVPVSTVAPASLAASSPTATPPVSLAPAPRHLASLSEGFTGSRGELAESAEAETNNIPRMQKTMDEERYVQALHYAHDHLVNDLDYDISERLAAALLPRNLPGDRNFYHLGTALGVPLAVMEGMKTFDELLVHLRRRRVLLVTLLKAVRALNRMDALYALSVWVLQNYAPSPQVAPQVNQREHPLAGLPETQCPREERPSFSIDPSDAMPVQETGGAVTSGVQ